MNGLTGLWQFHWRQLSAPRYTRLHPESWASYKSHRNIFDNVSHSGLIERDKTKLVSLVNFRRASRAKRHWFDLSHWRLDKWHRAGEFSTLRCFWTTHWIPRTLPTHPGMNNHTFWWREAACPDCVTWAWQFCDSVPNEKRTITGRNCREKAELTLNCINFWCMTKSGTVQELRGIAKLKSIESVDWSQETDLIEEQ
jgi:hypothetical protein